MYSLFEMIYDCLFERSDSALNHFEMIYLLSLWNDISKETVFCTPLACSECLPIESWPNSIGKHPAEKIGCYPFEMIYDFHFEMSDSDHNHFEMMYVLSFRNEQYSSVFISIWYMTVISKWRRKNFRTENPFRQRGWLKTSWRKCPPNPYFVHRFFRSDCPLAAWKYKS